MNKVLELQQLLIDCAKNIAYLKQNNIFLYTSLPNGVKMPYIKIIGIENNDELKQCDIQTFVVSFFIATNGKNNSQVIEICDCLSSGLGNAVNDYFLQNKTKCNIKIFNIYNYKYNITEDLQNDMWYGKLSISVDVL